MICQQTMGIGNRVVMFQIGMTGKIAFGQLAFIAYVFYFFVLFLFRLCKSALSSLILTVVTCNSVRKVGSAGPDLLFDAK